MALKKVDEKLGNEIVDLINNSLDTSELSSDGRTQIIKGIVNVFQLNEWHHVDDCDCPDCDNCDQRMGEPRINEGYM